MGRYTTNQYHLPGNVSPHNNFTTISTLGLLAGEKSWFFWLGPLVLPHVLTLGELIEDRYGKNVIILVLTLNGLEDRSSYVCIFFLSVFVESYTYMSMCIYICMYTCTSTPTSSHMHVKFTSIHQWIGFKGKFTGKPLIFTGKIDGFL